MDDRPRSDFGPRLREARERRGISLRQISNRTRIGIRALQALERNDVSGLPGGIFSRAYVRSYALEVGLDPEATIREFLAQFPDDSVTAGHPASIAVEDQQAVEADRLAALAFVRLIAVSIPIAAALIYFSNANRSVSMPAPDAEAPAQTAPATTTAPTGQTTTVDERSGTLTVSLSARRESWVSATVDGDPVIARLMRPGEHETLEIQTELVLATADAAALVVTLNGADVRPLGRPGEPVTARLSVTNFREFLAEQ